MMNRIEKLIPTAIKMIEKVGIPQEGTLKVDKEFKGYFASFGASIVQSGLLPAVIFFENEESDTKASREKVPLAILELLKAQNPEDETLKEALRLSEYILQSNNGQRRILKQTAQAAVALKIALRTYSFNEEAQNNEPNE